MAQPKRSPVSDTSDRELILSRVFDAPRDLVWEAWTDPLQVAQWWGPNGFTTTIEIMDVRPGGHWRHVMHGPNGTDYPNDIVFLEVVKHERIVYSNKGGKKGEPDVQFESTWTFEEQQGKTKVTLHMIFPTAEVRKQVVEVYKAIEGGEQTLGRLAEHLAGSSSLGAAVEPPRFENGKTLLVAGMRQHYAPQNMKELPELWQRFAPHIGSIPGQVGLAAYGLCFNANSPDGMDYMTAVEVRSASGLPADFQVTTVPAQKFAVFSHRGHVSKLFETLSAIDKWIFTSGLRVAPATAEAPSFFERYSEEFNPQTGMGGMEVWVPIEP